MILSKPFDSLWLDTNLATLTEERGYGAIEDGALAVDKGRIAWVGAARALPPDAMANAKTIHRLGGAWITPGLVDCHTHLVYAGNRAREFEMRLGGASYEEIARAGGGIVSTVRSVREADEETLFQQSLQRLAALLACGVTTVEIKSGYGLDLENEIKMLQVIRRLGQALPVDVQATFLGAHALPPEFKNRPDDYISLVVEKMIPAIAAQKLATAVDVFCETIAFSPEQTERVFRAAFAHGLNVKLHAEQLSDSKGAVLAARFKALSVDHLECLDPADVPLLKGCTAVLLPGAFYFLHESRKPPVRALRDAGVPIAVSTDHNPGTSPCLSLPTIMNMSCVLFELTPAEALAGATKHAARALGLESEIGTLSPGKAADLAIWDITSPAELACQFGGNPLRAVVKGGCICNL
ncbi:MAG: imidazolonepropionase [Syntrophobacteraceae bacterium]